MKQSARVRANRRNAKLSTGPRSAVGKKRVGRNALRHGLAVPVGMLPEAGEDVARLTRLIAGEAADPYCLDLARRVAEAQVDLLRVRRARAALLAKPWDGRSRVAVREIETFYKEAQKVLDGKGDPDLVEELIRKRNPPPPTDKNEYLAAVIAQRSSALQRLDRYERRALSRRKSAIRAWDRLPHKK